MEHSDVLREAAKVVEVLESAGVTVEDVSVSDGDDGTPLDIRLQLPAKPLDLPVLERDEVPHRRGRSDATVDTGSTAGVGENDGGDAGTDEPSSTRVRCPIGDCEETFDSEHGTKIHVAKCHGDVPAHRDPKRLAAVYERHDTFTAMRDALAVDVTAQTVRRNMMKHGIHDPDGGDEGRAGDADLDERGTRSPGPDDDSSDRGGRAPDDAPVVGGHDTVVEDRDDEATARERPAATDGGGDAVTAPSDDGTATGRRNGTEGGPAAAPDSSITIPAGVDVDLPGDVSPGEFVEVVADARTLFDVQRALEVDRPETKTLLADLGLLEFVHGRVADQEQRRETPVRAVERRLREQFGTG